MSRSWKPGFISPKQLLIAAELIRTRLAANPDATVAELAKAAGVSSSFVSSVRAAWRHREELRK